MERARLAAQLLNQIAEARAAIAASYLRLWRPEGRSLPDRVQQGADAPSEQTVRESGRGRPDPADDPYLD
jgi:hypothetical protein